MSEQEKDNDLRTIIHAVGDDVPVIDAAGIRRDAIPDDEPEPLLPPARSHWLSRLIATALLVWLAVVWSEAVVWGWSLSPWAGMSLLVIGGGIVVGFLILAWQAHRARRQIDEIAQIQAHFKQAVRSSHVAAVQGDLKEWVHRIRHLYRRSPRRDELWQGLAEVDESWSFKELADHLGHWYAAQDAQAAQLVKRESTRTGLFIAASPYPALDLLLVAWRNAAMVERVAAIYGLKLSATARWRLYQMILRNIAFTTVTETMLDSVSQSWLSNILLQVGVRAGQGVGVALYSIRIGHQTMKLCRVVPEDRPLVDRNIARMVVDAVRGRA
jgi:putative membrane protein